MYISKQRSDCGGGEVHGGMLSHLGVSVGGACHLMRLLHIVSAQQVHLTLGRPVSIPSCRDHKTCGLQCGMVTCGLPPSHLPYPAQSAPPSPSYLYVSPAQSAPPPPMSVWEQVMWLLSGRGMHTCHSLHSLQGLMALTVAVGGAQDGERGVRRNG